MTEEIFYLVPEMFGFDPMAIDKVHLVGEFNDWGYNNLDNFALKQDNSLRWTGIFKVPKGRGLYKFILNRNSYFPSASLMSYCTAETCKWAKNAIWYQILPDRFARSEGFKNQENFKEWNEKPDYFNSFGGSLRGIIENLDHIRKLFGSLENVAIYLNPMHFSSASNHKYWPENFAEIDPTFGTEDDLKELAKILHKENGKIIIDLVYNHTGLNHYAFLDVLKNGKNSKYRNWYRHLPEEKIEIPLLEYYEGDLPSNVEILNDPRNPSFDQNKETVISVWGGKYKFPIVSPLDFINATGAEIIEKQPHYRLYHKWNKPNYACWMGLFEMPELNAKDENLKKHLFEVSKKWLRLGIDGFRLDVPDLLNDSHAFWADFRKEMAKEAINLGKKPDEIYITGEIWTNNGLTASFLCGNETGNPLRFDSIMNYPLRENILNFLSGDILNHACDQIRREGRISAAKLDRNIHKNILYVPWNVTKTQYNVLSSHDTRRLSNVFSDDKNLKAALIFEFAMPGAPSIYYGEEIGMQGGKDPENRAVMPWDKVQNLENNQESFEIFEFYQKLIKIRRNYKCLTSANVHTLLTDDDKYAFGRYISKNDCAICVIKAENYPETTEIDLNNSPFAETTKWQNYFNSKVYNLNNGIITVDNEDFAQMNGLLLIPVKN